ncbi:flippase-like domain-containing protein [archaeon]|jgi:glycosyltransferase 2 family protein|nr:flippase-like domain-containing protein [archaeon]MBT4396863.1 flippase-like domain-containing protein [archaeon]MBT4441459.1 flippase-like domain-containing protein [archaeon]
MKKYLEHILKWSLAAVIIFFLVWYFLLHYNQIDWSSIVFNPVFLVISFVLLFLDYLMLANVWRVILKKLKSPLPFYKANKVYFASILGRYVPGKVMLLVGRIYLGGKEGVDKKIIITSIILEVALLVVSGIILFIPAIFFFDNIPLWLIIISMSLIPVILVLLIPSLFKRILNFGLKLIKRKPIKLDLHYRDILEILVMHLGRWLIDAMAIYFLFRSITPLPYDIIYVLPGIVGISTVAGVLAIVAPGGVGVREGALVLLLSPFVGAPMAILLSLVSRLWYVIAEVLFAGFFGIIHRND